MPCSVWFLAAQSVTGQRFKTKKRRKKDQKVSPIYILLDLSVKSKLEYIGLGLDVRFNIVRAASVNGTDCCVHRTYISTCSHDRFNFGHDRSL